ncbi:hypothetical protein COLU111180_00845 [Cohnella lubricantis]|uniref:SynChlorMet cassette protein ScmC n=1 Tax=Cohnella lubricantis TaxID=2163172 RepID=A0A841T9Y4_9BACL|nr:hypothetical protein [Cohnella lubricantis]MBB6676856.1 hypothetical protein [Cohnella lubricantis]MBP2119436.1 hypothetical protein [Cohnella lubricantis]
MFEHWQRIGSHLIRFRIDGEEAERMVELTIGDHWLSIEHGLEPDYEVAVAGGFGAPYEGVDPVRFEPSADGATVTVRTDYRIESSADGRRTSIRFHDYFGLRTALLNWYSRVLEQHGWGVIIHSSCVVHDDMAYLFAGLSGAGKTTIAGMSRPRPLLADETSIVEIARDGGVLVHDSPFRNDFREHTAAGPYPLRGIYLIKQSLDIRSRQISRSEALLNLLNKIVHWQKDPLETQRLIQRCKTLVERVPAYELYFQKNDLFWEAIS